MDMRTRNQAEQKVKVEIGQSRVLMFADEAQQLRPHGPSQLWINAV